MQKNGSVAEVHSMLNLIITLILGAIFGKNRQIWVDPHISDSKTDPLIPFGANLFIYLNHIGIQIT